MPFRPLAQQKAVNTSALDFCKTLSGGVGHCCKSLRRTAFARIIKFQSLALANTPTNQGVASSNLARGGTRRCIVEVLRIECIAMIEKAIKISQKSLRDFCGTPYAWSCTVVHG
jgi:hypothetical protein